MNRHAVLTDDTVDDTALLAALEAAGIEAQAKPLNLHRAAKMAADIISGYPDGQREQARNKLIAWLDEALDAADDDQLEPGAVTDKQESSAVKNIVNAAKNIIDIAKQYRIDHPGHSGGVVLVYNGEPCGWKDRLRNPEGERPGTYAVDDDGRAWEAIGGDDYHGAVTWEVRA